jgi:DNA repair exonuclease SbcCD nuclease subunit
MENEFGEVEAIYVAGNHDQDKQNWMAQALNLYFSNNPNVNVNDKDEMRKYIDY